MNKGKRGLGDRVLAGASLAMLACLAAFALHAPNAQAQNGTVLPPSDQSGTGAVTAGPSYVELVDLADRAAIVAIVRIRSQAVVEPERAPGLQPGSSRLYLEAETQALLSGPSAIGGSLVFLADAPMRANGKPPKLRKENLIVFADPVPGTPGTIQLVEPDAILPLTEDNESRVRAIVASLVAADSPPVVTAVRDVISVPGNLAGESETQMFLQTGSGAPVSLSVLRRPGMAPQWGVSWSEIVDQAMERPAKDTLAWYRLACFLPPQLPEQALIGSDPTSRTQASIDYALIIEELGSCDRDGD